MAARTTTSEEDEQVTCNLRVVSGRLVQEIMQKIKVALYPTELAE